MDEHAPIRNYQRVFRPDHRIYAIDGRTIPVPGGVPIMWLAYFAATLTVVIVLQSGSVFMALLLAVIAALYGLYVGGVVSAAIAAVIAFLLVPVVGGMLGQIDWPLRLLILPALVATLGTQLAPDGRRPHRYVASWLSFYLRPHRRSLGRPVAIEGAAAAAYRPELWVAPDRYGVRLRRARVRGAGIVRFRDELAISARGRGRRRTVTARKLPAGQQPRRREVMLDSVELESHETLEVRP